MLNFPSKCSRDWNICAVYDLRGRLPLTGALTLTGTRKPTVRCLITRPNYPLWEQKSLSEYPHIQNMQVLDQTSFKIFHLHINNQTPWKVLQMRQHVSTGFWYATFAYIWNSQLSKIIWKFRYNAVNITLWCIGFLIPVRVNVPVRGSRPRKSHLAQIFQYPEEMLGKFSFLFILKWTWVAVRLIWYVTVRLIWYVKKYFIT